MHPVECAVILITIKISSNNLLQVPCTSWFDDEKDRELLDLIPYLEALSGVDDVVVSIRNNRNARYENIGNSDEDG